MKIFTVILYFLYLVSALLSSFAFANEAQLSCESLFGGQALSGRQQSEIIQANNFVRVNETMDLLMPALMSHNQSPTVLVQFVLIKTSEVMSHISKFNSSPDVVDTPFQKSLASLLSTKSEEVLKSFDEAGAEIEKAKKFYERLSQKEKRLAQIVRSIPEKIRDAEELRNNALKENELLNERYIQVSKNNDELFEEIDFINQLIKKIQTELAQNIEFQSLDSEMRSEVLPMLMRIAVDLHQLQLVVNGARSGIEGRIKANILAIDQSRKVTEVGLPVLLKNHPSIKIYLNEKEQHIEPSEIKFTKGEQAYYNDRLVLVKKVLPEGKVRLKMKGIWSQQTVSLGDIASTNKNIVSKGFRTGDTVLYSGQEVKIIAIYPTGKILVNLSSAQPKTVDPNELASLKKGIMSQGFNVGEKVITGDSSKEWIISGIYPNGTFALVNPSNGKAFYKVGAKIASTDKSLSSEGVRIGDRGIFGSGYGSRYVEILGIFLDGDLAIQNANGTMSAIKPADLASAKEGTSYKGYKIGDKINFSFSGSSAVLVEIVGIYPNGNFSVLMGSSFYRASLIE